MPTRSPHREAQRRTEQGLLLAVIAFALIWVPYVTDLGGLLLLVAWVLLWLGRKGYGESHRRRMILGGGLILLSFVISFVFVLWFAVAVVGSATTAGVNAAALTADLQVLLVGVAIAAIFGALAEVAIPYGLADRATDLLLWLAFGVQIVMSSVELVVGRAVLATAIQNATTGSTVSSSALAGLQGQIALLTLFNALPAALWAWAYYRTRQRVVARIRDAPDPA